MPIIRKMRKLKKHRNEVVCIYSGDADQLVLSLINNKTKMYVIQEVNENIKMQNQKLNVFHQQVFQKYQIKHLLL